MKRNYDLNENLQKKENLINKKNDFNLISKKISRKAREIAAKNGKKITMLVIKLEDI